MAGLNLVLINPLTPNKLESPNLGLAYTAQAAEDSGHNVCIIDASSALGNYTMKTLMDEVASLKPDVLGFTFCTDYIPMIYRQIKAMKPLARLVIAGGPHPTTLPEEALNNGVDVVVRHEGEDTIGELLDVFQSGGDFSGVNGISYIGEGRVIHNPDRALITDLDRIKPARHLINYEHYSPAGSVRSFETIITSRGCPAKCTFCSSFAMGKKAVRLRSAKSVVEEIIELKEKYAFNTIRISDDTFTWDKQRTMDICNALIERKVDVKWSCVTRVSSINYELLKLMKEAGCYMITFGFESFEPETLKRIKKGITVQQMKNAVDWATDLGFVTKGNVIHGWPWETREELEKTEQELTRLKQKGVLIKTRGMLIPYYGTELYNAYHETHRFTNWWLEETEDPDKPKHVPWFRSGAIGSYFDDPILERNFFNYSEEMIRQYQKLITLKGWQVLGESFATQGVMMKSIQMFFFYLSRALFQLSPNLEFIVFKNIKAVINSARRFKNRKKKFTYN